MSVAGGVVPFRLGAPVKVFSNTKKDWWDGKVSEVASIAFEFQGHVLPVGSVHVQSAADKNGVCRTKWVVPEHFSTMLKLMVAEGHPEALPQNMMAQVAVARQADSHPTVVLKDIADSTGAVVAQVPNGCLLTILAEHGDFVQVRREAVDGYAQAKNLERHADLPQQAVAQQAEGHPMVVMKDIADSTGAVVAQVPNGHLLTIIAEHGDFVQVRQEAVKGYARVENLKRQAAEASPITELADERPVPPCWALAQVRQLSRDEIGCLKLARPELIVESLNSVSIAVQKLNDGSLKLAEEFCIVYSMSKVAFFLLYNRGSEAAAEAAVKLANKATLVQIAAPVPSPDAAVPKVDASATDPVAASPEKPAPKLAAPGYPRRDPPSQNEVLAGLETSMNRFHVYLEGPGGQELIYETFSCYKFVESLANSRRARDSNVHANLTFVTSGICVGAGVVVLGASIAASAGALAPAVAAGVVVAGANVAAVAAVAPVVGGLVALGFGDHQARCLAERINSLEEKLKDWDVAFGDVADKLHHVSDVGLLEQALGGPAMTHFVKKLQAGAAGVARSVALRTMLGHASKGNSLAAFQKAVAGGNFAGVKVVHAGSAAARGMFYASTGVSVVLGVKTLLEMHDAPRNHSSMADAFDAQADKCAALLHTMLDVSCGTPAHSLVVGQVPEILSVHIEECQLPQSSLRLGDPLGGYAEVEAYWALTLEPRIRNTKEEPCLVTPDKLHKVEMLQAQHAVGGHRQMKEKHIESRVHMRLHASDDRLTIQAFRNCDWQAYVRGDAEMGGPVSIQLDTTAGHHEEHLESLQMSTLGVAIKTYFKISYEILGSETVSPEEQHAFLDLVKKNIAEEVKRLVADKPGLINVQPCRAGRRHKRWSALHHAANNGNADLVEFLVSKGAAFDATSEEMGWQSLGPIDVAREARKKAQRAQKNTRPWDEIIEILEKRLKQARELVKQPWFQTHAIVGDGDVIETNMGHGFTFHHIDDSGECFPYTNEQNAAIERAILHSPGGGTLALPHLSETFEVRWGVEASSWKTMITGVPAKNSICQVDVSFGISNGNMRDVGVTETLRWNKAWQRALLVDEKRQHAALTASPLASTTENGPANAAHNFHFHHVGPDGERCPYTPTQSAAIESAILHAPHGGNLELPDCAGAFEMRWGDQASSLATVLSGEPAENGIIQVNVSYSFSVGRTRDVEVTESAAWKEAWQKARRSIKHDAA